MGLYRFVNSVLEGRRKVSFSGAEKPRSPLEIRRNYFFKPCASHCKNQGVIVVLTEHCISVARVSASTSRSSNRHPFRPNSA